MLLGALVLALVLGGALWGLRLRDDWEAARRSAPPAPEPTAKEAFLARIAGCEKDPSQWVLRPIPDLKSTGEESFLARQSYLWGLPSACQYGMLGREVAFYMLRGMGYSAEEARRVVGVDRFYYRKGGTPRRQVVTELGPAVRDILWPVGLETPLLQWDLASDGAYRSAFVVWGCYSGRGPDRAGEYPFECVVRELYRAGPGYARFEDAVFKLAVDKPGERVMFWGYRGDGRWEYIGDLKKPVPVEDVDYVLKVYAEVARAHGVEVWDAGWLKKTFGAQPRPLPEGAEGWPSDEAAGNRILERIDAAER